MLRNSLKSYGGDEGIRTLGLCLAKAALSQLSHIPRLSYLLTCRGLKIC